MSFHVRASRNLDWIAQRIGNFHYTPAARAIEAIDERDNRIVGMVAYDGLMQNCAQVSIALDTPIAWRALARPTFRYPFLELGKGVLISFVTSANKRSLELTEHVGFRPTHRIDDAIMPGVHLVIFEMRREECRWLEG